MARTRSVSPPPPYSSTPPSISGSSLISTTPPPSYSTNSPASFKHAAASAPASTITRHGDEQAPLLDRGRRRSRRHYSVEGPTASQSSSREVQVVSVILSLLLAIGVIFLLYRQNQPKLSPPVPTYSVAIIGAGPAGIAAARHLRNSPAVRGVELKITLYESKPIIGGVLAFHDANGNFVLTKDDPMLGPITAEDIAGTALMWNNVLFTQDSEKTLKDKVDFIGLDPERIGYYDNKNRKALTVRPYKKMPMTTWLWLLWSYGGSVWRADQLARDGNLRNSIRKAPLVPVVEQIFQSLGVLERLKLPAKDVIKKHGISEKYAAEILEPQVQRAYGQGLDEVTGLAAMLAIAQEETANIYMGGDLIERLQRIVDEINLTVRTSTRVTGIKYVGTTEEQPSWLIRHESTEDGNSVSSTETFDRVIVAALDMGIQLEDSNSVALNMTSFHENVLDESEVGIIEATPTIPVHITFFISETKLSSWDDENKVLFIDAKKVDGIREIALVREVLNLHDNTTGLEYLYRVFSDSPILEKFQDRTKISWSYETTIDKAYPVLFPFRKGFPPFELPWAKGFWWTSVMHYAGTTVDLSWLAGKVVAEALIKDVCRK
ncbi:hypothetical protein GGS21DRAFT_455979 [Xylaria nigripes]|nr:hypothetical protein GGS21DRAFT_455979 [Xylaria nigripes]